ncbi:hypothetical protein HUN41_00268 [Streptomyces phage Coruscant]|uniref:Uncharacterized protein n=1 Tax=Streptomyces phage Coruscant TaxID=2739834 RepID=A0A7G4AVU2_9CAUD|nr:hypothetical protein PP454_gp002 [Streptomyces phage Coruscant]YP_010651591.1 hypothetical protein PP454_gp061 [Streptomyces phage Coruscant]QMP84132.1 hypothetical protein HUN41_00002 [Streptomyces phage Coruscant]QMP84356.1 hypothetical protein HUN41_00268 [Streptomyces phage Coruscant]
MFELYDEGLGEQWQHLGDFPDVTSAVDFANGKDVEFFTVYRKNGSSYIYCSW